MNFSVYIFNQNDLLESRHRGLERHLLCGRIHQVFIFHIKILRSSQASGLTIQHMELYKRSLSVESETIQKSMVDVSNLMSRCHQLNESLRPMDDMANQM